MKKNRHKHQAHQFFIILPAVNCLVRWNFNYEASLGCFDHRQNKACWPDGTEETHRHLFFISDGLWCIEYQPRAISSIKTNMWSWNFVNIWKSQLFDLCDLIGLKGNCPLAPPYNQEIHTSYTWSNKTETISWLNVLGVSVGDIELMYGERNNGTTTIKSKDKRLSSVW